MNTSCLFFLLQVIYFFYSNCKSSYAIYYIEFTLLFALKRCFKKEHVFYCWTLNDVFYSDDINTVKLQFISLSEITVFLFLKNFGISMESM
jgi:hypothetical protein